MAWNLGRPRSPFGWEGDWRPHIASMRSTTSAGRTREALSAERMQSSRSEPDAPEAQEAGFGEEYAVVESIEVLRTWHDLLPQRGRYTADHLAEADANKPVTLAPAAHDHSIAVFEKHASFPIG